MSNHPIPFFGEIEQQGGNFVPVMPQPPFFNPLVSRAVVANPLVPLYNSPVPLSGSVPIPLPHSGNPMLFYGQPRLVVGSRVDNFKNSAARNKYNDLEKELGRPSFVVNHEDGLVKWNDGRLTHRLMDNPQDYILTMMDQTLQDASVITYMNLANNNGCVFMYDKKNSRVKVKSDNLNKNLSLLMCIKNNDTNFPNYMNNSINTNRNNLK
jgi:hypothetical protein